MNERKVKEYRRLLRKRYKDFQTMVREYTFTERMKLAWAILWTWNGKDSKEER